DRLPGFFKMLNERLHRAHQGVIASHTLNDPKPDCQGERVAPAKGRNRVQLPSIELNKILVLLNMRFMLADYLSGAFVYNLSAFELGSLVCHVFLV
ncbi:MAG: hypothetical protein NT123_24585, partial [Proteobacteria bacterium]|nr:hypothetical protein [Pseudomonadota bacterium]